MYQKSALKQPWLTYINLYLCFIVKQIGAKYEEENEKDLKDQMDFPSPPNIPSQLSKLAMLT